MEKLENYIIGEWKKGSGDGKVLRDSATGAEIAVADTTGLDFEKILAYGRNTGGPNLRKLTLRERGLMLKKLALHLHKEKDKFYPISYKTGATKADSWIDIEGGIGNLFANASLRKRLPDSNHLSEGEAIPLSKDHSFMGHHILVPRRGIAVHINAFNFPIWGMLEKIAVNLLAGMPALVKPATDTSYLTQAMVQEIISTGILPEGSLQLVCGSARKILDHLEGQDVVTFTGSAETGRKLKVHTRIIEESVPFNMEADSLNAAVLGRDAVPGSPEFDLFVKEVRREMTIKCGQKCTAIRRIIVPEKYREDVRLALTAQLNKVKIGDPSDKSTRMGALVSREQVREVHEKIEEMLRSAEPVFGYKDSNIEGVDMEKGAFMKPVLLEVQNPFDSKEVHEVEAFGPVSTLMTYETIEEAAEITALGKGSLVCSYAGKDKKAIHDFTIAAAPYHGRILILNHDMAEANTGHGSPLPMLVHGGPGRAGGGEEMGGMRGLAHYMQRTAIQGHPTAITAITHEYQYGADMQVSDIHPFKKHFEELEIGDTVITHKRTITEADIINFANVSWDHFYAHSDTTSLEGTIFEERVAHGYFILSAAAGLFVDPGKGPVLLNYGIEECRFVKPVYAGATIGVKFTVKAKHDQEKKSEDDVPKGIVKFLVEVYDQEDETVALATILTMVKKLENS